MTARKWTLGVAALALLAGCSAPVASGASPAEVRADVQAAPAAAAPTAAEVTAPDGVVVRPAPVVATVLAPPPPPPPPPPPVADPAPSAEDRDTQASRSRSRATGPAGTVAAPVSRTPAPAPVPAPPPAAPDASGDYEAGLLAGVNAARRDAGLAPLATSSCADSRAESWAAHLAASGAFAHQDIGAVMSGCGASKAAENIARTGGSAASMVRMWLDSPGHRANILDPALTHVGTGAVLSGGQWTGVQVFLSL